MGERRGNVPPLCARRLRPPDVGAEKVDQHLVDARVRQERLDERTPQVDRLTVIPAAAAPPDPTPFAVPFAAITYLLLQKKMAGIAGPKNRPNRNPAPCSYCGFELSESLNESKNLAISAAWS